MNRFYCYRGMYNAYLFAGLTAVPLKSAYTGHAPGTTSERLLVFAKRISK
jgi:hypothetical protein